MTTIKKKAVFSDDELNSCNLYLDYHGIKSGIFGKCEHWLLSNEGDLICMTPRLRGGYAIYSQRLSQEDWRAHLSGKDWVTEEILNSFSEAYSCAVELAGIKDS